MIVGVDANGFYDLTTGEPVDLIYDPDSGQFYNALTGESAQLIGDAINAARDTLIGVFGHQGYPQTGRVQTSQQYPQQNQQRSQSTSPGTFNAQGISLKWYTLVGIGAGLAFIFLGKKIR